MDLEPIQTGPLHVNTFVVPLAGSAVFIVDPAASELTNDENAIIDYIDEHEAVPIGILLTHGHFDHVMGLKTLRKAFPGICIAIHEKDKECLGEWSEVTQEQFLEPLGAISILDAVSNLPSADVTFQNGQTLASVFSLETIVSSYSGDPQAPDIEAVQHELEKWKIIHTPGHTPGSSCFYNESEKKLISGDTLFYKSYGRTDFFGGSEIDMQHSLSVIKDTLPSDTAVYPGHDNYGFTLAEN